MKSSSSLAGRAVLAVILMVGFYLLALAISAVLLYLPIAEVLYLHHVTPKLDLICLIAGFVILWSVVPRFDRFKASGPRLTPEKNPRLFTEIESVATSVGQTMPAEVYLVSDVNGWVSQRGGLMGFGSRRVMGLGLPLLRTLNQSQFRAVLAHEFGHYYGGDTKLGPWIYKTRNTIMRTLSGLGRGSWIQKPFLWYGKMFLRITHAISRRQEFVADELAARTVGSKPLITGLSKIHGAGSVFGLFWRNECVPVLHAGFRPPLAEGFSQFLQANPIDTAIKRGLEEELKSGKVNPYDTHPPLKERIAAVENLPPGKMDDNDPPALSLLQDVPGLEQQLFQAIAPAEAAKLKPVDWAEVCARVYLPQWIELVKKNTGALNKITPESLSASAGDRKTFGKQFVDASGKNVDAKNAEALAGVVIGAALVLAISRKGGKPVAKPGESVSVILGSHTLEPFGLLESLATGRITAEAWRDQVAALGITSANLGETGTTGSDGQIPSEDNSRYQPKG